MKRRSSTPCRPGFTLIEAVLSVAVLAFALAVIIGALGSAARLAAREQSKNTALQLLGDCFNDIRAGTASRSERSTVFQLELPATPPIASVQQRWFDIDGRPVDGESNAFFRCELAIRPDPSPGLVHLHGHVRWPARGNPHKPDGETELLTSIALP